MSQNQQGSSLKKSINRLGTEMMRKAKNRKTLRAEQSPERGSSGAQGMEKEKSVRPEKEKLRFTTVKIARPPESEVRSSIRSKTLRKKEEEKEEEVGGHDIKTTTKDHGSSGSCLWFLKGCKS